MSNPITPLTVEQTDAAIAGAKQDSYVRRLLLSVDIAANVALGGKEDETISTDTALMARKHEFVGLVMSRFLDLFQKDHGAEASAGDLQRAEAEVARLKESGLLDAK